eukprot:XP_001699253.1 predicted protein [Chlamydomonas reinhardtii]
MPPRPPTAAGGVRLAPGQVAFASGRSGTPLPKFGPLGLPGAVPGAQGQAAGAQAGGFRPLLGAAGAGTKRHRESPAASPLMASGIRNLSDFKRRRQAMAQQPRSVLAGLSARTPRDTTPVNSDGERTPGGFGSGGSGAGGASAATTPAPAQGTPGAGGELPATETARKILETLDNSARVSGRKRRQQP